MENQFEPNKSVLTSFLLPRRYRLIGYVMTALTLAALGIRMIMDNSLVLGGSVNLPVKPDINLIMLKVLLIVGLLFIAAAREAVEDELIALLRMRAMQLTILIGILYVIAVPVIAMLNAKIPELLSTLQLTSALIFLYIILFAIQKKLYL